MPLSASYLFLLSRGSILAACVIKQHAAQTVPHIARKSGDSLNGAAPQMRAAQGSAGTAGLRHRAAVSHLASAKARCTLRNSRIAQSPQPRLLIARWRQSFRRISLHTRIFTHTHLLRDSSCTRSRITHCDAAYLWRAALQRTARAHHGILRTRAFSHACTRCGASLRINAKRLLSAAIVSRITHARQ